MIARAVTCLGSQCDIVIRQLSGMYLTRAWGDEDQDDFVNAVVQADTHLAPAELLSKIKGIEKCLGRRDGARWGPREIDIDILLYGNEIVVEDRLRIPHEHICERGFVLAPLVEIAPDLVHPETGVRVSSYLEGLMESGETSWRNLDI
jgi:2-amino-4-hydroxy-6-hydroxymethyldihydropteridine diphosphokinase